MISKPMRKLSAFLIAVFLAAFLVAPGVSTAVEVGQKAPDFKLPGTNGKEISLSQFRGKKLVLVQFYVASFFPT